MGAAISTAALILALIARRPHRRRRRARPARGRRRARVDLRLCLGCQVFALLMRAGVIPERCALSAPTSACGAYELSPSAAPRRMSCSETSISLEPEQIEHARQDHDAGDDRRRPVGLRARRPGAAPRAACAGEPSRIALALGPRRARSRGPSPGRRGRGAWAIAASEVAVPATAIACSTSSRRSSRDRVGEDRAGRPRGPRRARRRSAGRCAMWRSVWRTTPAWVETWNSALRPRADHELGRAAADVDDQRRRVVVRVAVAGRAEERQPRLLVAGEDVGVEAVAVATVSANSSPLAASRTALVSTASARRRRGARSAAR